MLPQLCRLHRLKFEVPRYYCKPQFRAHHPRRRIRHDTHRRHICVGTVLPVGVSSTVASILMLVWAFWIPAIGLLISAGQDELCRSCRSAS